MKPKLADVTLLEITENLLSEYTIEELYDIEQQAIDAVDALANLTDEEILEYYDSWEEYNSDYFEQLEIVEWFIANQDLLIELYNMNLGGNVINEETT